jgi:hypothetical protein
LDETIPLKSTENGLEHGEICETMIFYCFQRK